MESMTPSTATEKLEQHQRPRGFSEETCVVKKDGTNLNVGVSPSPHGARIILVRKRRRHQNARQEEQKEMLQKEGDFEDPLPVISVKTTLTREPPHSRCHLRWLLCCPCFREVVKNRGFCDQTHGTPRNGWYSSVSFAVVPRSPNLETWNTPTKNTLQLLATQAN